MHLDPRLLVHIALAAVLIST